MSNGTPPPLPPGLPASAGGRSLRSDCALISGSRSGVDLSTQNDSSCRTDASQSSIEDDVRPTSCVQQQQQMHGTSSYVSSPRSRARNSAEWECVDVLRAGPNPRWRCKSCHTDYTGAPRRIAQHILGAGGVGQIKACPSPIPEYVTLMTDLMALDSESGRLVKKARSGEDAGGGSGGTGGGFGGPVGGMGSSILIGAGTSAGGASAGSALSALKPGRKMKARTAVQQQGPAERFEVFVGKEDFKFSSSHFVAFDGYRERLHGHNYSVSVRLKGQVCEDGYVVDFGIVKQKTRKVCKELNERFLCPTQSDVIKITVTPSQVLMECQDGATFVMPTDDCALLPLLHSTAEELAHYIFTRLLREFSLHYLHARGVTDMEITVSEMPRQEATYKGKVPLSEDLIRDPPFMGGRQVHGCCVRDGEDNNIMSSSSGGVGTDMPRTVGNGIALTGFSSHHSNGGYSANAEVASAASSLANLPQAYTYGFFHQGPEDSWGGEGGGSSGADALGRGGEGGRQIEGNPVSLEGAVGGRVGVLLGAAGGPIVSAGGMMPPSVTGVRTTVSSSANAATSMLTMSRGSAVPSSGQGGAGEDGGGGSTGVAISIGLSHDAGAPGM